MIPGRTTSLRLTAERPGIYRGQCAEYCGGPHALMALRGHRHAASRIRRVARARSRARRARRRASRSSAARRSSSPQAAAPATPCAARAAAGTIGPDLTHIGSRRSVGIDTLPLTPNNITRFIAHGQHIKPGNRMPEFRIFSADEHAALAAYLLSLR